MSFLDRSDAGRRLANRMLHLRGEDVVVLALPRGGVISGRVSDENGDFMPGVTVAVLRYQYQQGDRQLVPSGRGQTDHQSRGGRHHPRHRRRDRHGGAA